MRSWGVVPYKKTATSFSMVKNIKIEDNYYELTGLFKEKAGWHKARVKFVVSCTKWRCI